MSTARRYLGQAVPFAPVRPEDDLLHAVAADAPFTMIETDLYGFNIPQHDVQCNIYFLWHTVLRTMSAHIFVFRGRKRLAHQLCADYFNEHLYLPAAADNGRFELQLGTCRVRHCIVKPLEHIHLEFDDAPRGFALDLHLQAALPPVGRPGGKHFTQLMRTAGSLTLDGERLPIDGHYVRDRSWGYPRPEEAELMPPYRWMNGWFGPRSGFVVAWLDVGMLDDPRFGPRWQELHQGGGDAAANKWESGGPTPSTNLRSGWIAIDGDVRQVVRMDVESRFARDPALLVEAIGLEIEDARGDVHRIDGRTTAMIPKMYWQNLVTYMHAIELRCGPHAGNGDLMDTYSGWHMRPHGP